MKILINDLHSVNSIALAKLLLKITDMEIEVWATDGLEYGHIAASLFNLEYRKAPSKSKPEEYLHFQKALCEDNNINYVIAASDSEVRFWNQNKHKIPIKVVLPNNEVISVFQDKKNASISMHNIGIQVPRIVQSLFGEKKIIFRKRESVASRGIYIVDLEKSQYIRNLFTDEYFSQEYIEGCEYTVDAFCDCNGTPKLLIPRLRIEIKDGMAYRCQLKYNKPLIDICTKIYKNYKIPGLSNIQFIANERGNFFIECNLRFAGSGISGIVGSFNYIEQYIRHFFFDEPLETFEYYMSNVIWNSIVTRYYEECVFNF